jgi:outer membrane protein assembly factor BamB
VARPEFERVAASGQTLPTKWNPSAAVWKTALPGRGHSSPIVVGQRVLLSTADERQQVQSVICYDRKNGKQLWKTDVNKGGFNPKIHRKNSHASPTVASNGTHVFAVFNNHGNVQVTALTLDGKKVWQEVAGQFMPKQYQFGYAPSPVLYKSTVIVVSDYESNGYIAALDHLKTQFVNTSSTIMQSGIIKGFAMSCSSPVLRLAHNSVI